MSGKAANGEGSLYREIDGAWRATYRVPGESRPRRVRGRTREEALRRRGQALTKALTVEPRPSTTTLSAIEHDRRVRVVVVEDCGLGAGATVIAGKVRRSRRADHGLARRRADRESSRGAGGDVAVAGAQLPLRKHCGRHQSNLPISHGRGGQPRSDRDEPSRPCTPTEDTDIDTAGAHGCRGSGRRRSRRGRPFRRRDCIAVRAGLARV